LLNLLKAKARKNPSKTQGRVRNEKGGGKQRLAKKKGGEEKREIHSCYFVVSLSKKKKWVRSHSDSSVLEILLIVTREKQTKKDFGKRQANYREAGNHGSRRKSRKDALRGQKEERIPGRIKGAGGQRVCDEIGERESSGG